jgi:hypothetical protein
MVVDVKTCAKSNWTMFPTTGVGTDIPWTVCTMPVLLKNTTVLGAKRIVPVNITGDGLAPKVFWLVGTVTTEATVPVKAPNVAKFWFGTFVPDMTIFEIDAGNTTGGGVGVTVKVPLDNPEKI